jgi:hypothetical protein
MNFVFKLVSYICLSFEPSVLGLWSRVVECRTPPPHLTPYAYDLDLEKPTVGARIFERQREAYMWWTITENYPIPGLQDYSLVLSSLWFHGWGCGAMAASYCVAELVFIAFVGTQPREGRFKAMVDPEQSATWETSPVPRFLWRKKPTIWYRYISISTKSKTTGKFEVLAAVTAKSAVFVIKVIGKVVPMLN